MDSPGRVPARHRLWVVDDVELELQAARRTLEHVYEVDEFRDGSSVLERFASGAELPDVLILDWHMKGVGGLEVLRFLRADPRTVGLPVLVFTSTGDVHDLLEALASGADDYLGKGSPAAELHARVATLIRSKSLRERAERAERDLASLLELEREARAEAEAANRAKDEFLATVSHELRTPLTAILGWARILKSGPHGPDTLARAIDTIERNAVAQARLIDDLLDVARIVSGKLRIELAPVDLVDPVEQAIETVRPSAAAKRISLTTDLHPGCVVAGDPARLQQIAWNLLTNAIKFTPPDGRVHVGIACRPDQVVLTVSDTGRGIPPELLPHVFERFRQADSTAARAHGGLGLGLAIVRRLVQLHEGEVTASSAGLGKGATFEVVLPAAWFTAHAPTAHVGKPEEAHLRGVSLLVVEDDPDTREFLATMLTGRGAAVLLAGSVAEALVLLDDHCPDVVLSDIAMPGQDGYALVRQLRACEDDTRRLLPVIAVSAHAREEDRSRALRSGFREYLSKPLDPDALVGAITRVRRSARSADPGRGSPP